MIGDKEGNIVSNTEKFLHGWSEYYEMHFDLQAGTDSDSGEEWTTCVRTAESHAGPSNVVDIEMAICKLITERLLDMMRSQPN
jgi:hypothetical protein